MKNRLATILTSAMLLLTTNSLPSYALNTHENSITNTATNQLLKNEETLISRRRWRRRRRRRRKIVCRTRRVYNQQQRKWARVRICRRVRRRFFVL